MQPGIYRGITNDAYHGGPGDSKSTLDVVRTSPAKLRAMRTGLIQREPTASQALGTAFHALVLEPAEFQKTYVRELQRAAVPDAIDDREELVAMVAELNSGRLAKLATSGDKATLAARILDAYAEMPEPPRYSAGDLEDLKGADLKAEIERLNASRAGLLQISGTRHELAAILRSNGVSVTLWSDVLDDWRAANEGRVVISADTWDQLHRMRDAVMAHPMARKLLSAPGESELSAYWMQPVVDPDTGEQVIGPDGEPAELLLRCRPDRLRYDGIMVDLKTTQPDHADPEGFARSVLNWRYHVQHAFYLNGARRALVYAQGDRGPGGMAQQFAQFDAPRAFAFVAVETDARIVDGVAKGVAVYMLDEQAVALGELEMQRDLYTLWNCYAESCWPGYSERIESLSLPAYAFTRAAASAAAIN